jgi:hypothetical protein
MKNTINITIYKLTYTKFMTKTIIRLFYYAKALIIINNDNVIFKTFDVIF